MPCTYCVGIPDWVIKKYNHWTVYLKKNQAYLGTVIIALNRHVPDLYSATSEEMAELQTVVQKFREMIKEMFGAKMFSYIGQTSLENLHANLQIVPRYDTQVTWGDMRFVDPGYGRGYDPVRNTQLTPGQYSELIDAMKEHLEGRPQEPTETENEEVTE